MTISRSASEVSLSSARSTTLAVSLAALSLAALCLGGCDSLRRAAGVDKSPPDEFSVVSRAPLELPPDYTLRPPRAGALRAQEVAPTDLARQTVFRAPDKNAPGVIAAGNLSAGEVAILKQAGAATAPSDIRKTINQETTKLSEPDRGFIDSLLFWKSEPAPGDIVDPQKEALRLQGNAASGKKAEDGETATIERKPTGFFSKIF
jgi:hypothetical protein